ncbi:MAG: hypothetical protein HFH49_11320 [Lachnospiraceae bacterium]|nr:hypothetical protein [Lachnospiraceae bacterium]
MRRDCLWQTANLRCRQSGKQERKHEGMLLMADSESALPAERKTREEA